MAKRLRTIGMILALAGLGFVIAGGVAFFQVQAGSDSLQAFSAAQNVTLSYNEDGQLVDRGTPEQAEAILAMLTDQWGYAINDADLDPNDPLVNTATEYMYQMATIGFHILHGTQTVVLTEPAEYNGITFEPGTYEVVVNEVGTPDRVEAGLGGYWTDFDRLHPLEGPARSQAWSGTAHSLFSQLGVGAITASTLQLGYALAGILAAIGLTFLAGGFGLWWTAKGRDEQFEVMVAGMPEKELTS